MRIVVAGATGTVGRHVVAVAQRRGHEVVPLSRSTGQDVSTGVGLDAALTAADAVIDVTSVASTSAAASVEFFGAATRHLLAAEVRQSVGHHVALSIVGIDYLPLGYYAGKVEQERLVTAGPVPFSILRTTQFHEFARQVLGRASFGPIALVPAGLLRPIAAADVADALVAIADGTERGRHRDLRGPRDEILLDMVRKVIRADGRRMPALGVSLPGAYWRGMRSGVLRGTGDEGEAPTTFDEWLTGERSS
ncbi:MULTISPECIES: SDR family oxidoreductase [unclassified Cryobacterium]|uniref:SDR family oxidoreductase n=1 Tax=unclassified Cryobacterium TaxID=2649013 RepID=UPI00106C24B8|nr:MULTISPECIES: NAD-dependent epimerase/dehydratase family protein [unclassified Cryobacterium]TFB95748.1 SDR family oxidoreductase [Cryobacterium sp. MDB2-A-1]TFC12062.1 SDR family oxidoreductase [Cryobacterium sp. MDB2-A-2]TFC15953.1 SDR family oxidoreductase [Cryobacterium sp. MDB2-10]